MGSNASCVGKQRSYEQVCGRGALWENELETGYNKGAVESAAGKEYFEKEGNWEQVYLFLA